MGIWSIPATAIESTPSGNRAANYGDSLQVNLVDSISEQSKYTKHTNISIYLYTIYHISYTIYQVYIPCIHITYIGEQGKLGKEQAQQQAELETLISDTSVIIPNREIVHNESQSLHLLQLQLLLRSNLPASPVLVCCLCAPCSLCLSSAPAAEHEADVEI